MNANFLGVTYKQLQAFTAIVEKGSFASAADHLDITQASISKHIRALESKCGTALFERRRGGKAALNSRGKQLYADIPELLRNFREISSGLGNMEASGGTLTVATGEYLYPYIQEAAADFLSQRPSSQVDIRIVKRESEAYSLLANADIDIAFLTRTEPPTDADVTVISQAYMSLYAAPSLFARMDEKAMRNLPLIMPEIGTPAEDFAKRCLKEIGIDAYTVAARAQHVTVSKSLCVRGAGVALLYEDDVREEVKSDRVIKLDIPRKIVYRCKLSSDMSKDLQEEFANSIINLSN